MTVPGWRQFATFSPTPGAEFPALLRNGRTSVAGTIAGIGLGLSTYLVLWSLVNQIVVAVAWKLSGATGPFSEYYAQSVRFENPWGMLGAHLGIAVLIPVSMGLLLVFHSTSPRWLVSVTGRIRWGYLAGAMLIAVALINGLHWLRTSAGMTVNPQQDFWLFLVVIIGTSPLQSAAEEIFFRGYLVQACGSLVTSPWFSIVASALVFALFHGIQNAPMFLDRFGFGLLMGVLVWRTGGLEAAIGCHVVNNLSAFIWAGLVSTVAEVRALQQIDWVATAWDLGTFALFTGLALALGVRLGLQTQVQPVAA